jgi:hypothetical protein
MRTVTFKSVVDGALARMGLDPLLTPSANTLAAFVEYANSVYRTAWEMYPWPDAVRFENRQFYDTWANGNSYSAGDVVLGSDGNYYYALQTNSAQNPVTDTADTYWALASSYTSSNGGGILYAINLDQVIGGTTQTPIGEVLGVFQSDPRTNRYATPVNWMLTNDGIVVGQNGLSVTSIPSTVWIQFTTRPAVFTTGNYSDGTTIPYVVAEAVKFGICAEAQREDGQFDKAAIHEAKVRECLNTEWDKIEMKQGQRGNFTAMTR